MTATQSQIRDALAELTDYECRPNGAPGNPLALSVAGCRTIRTILQSARDTQPNCIPLCATQGNTNERVSSGDDQSKVRQVDTQKPAGDVALDPLFNKLKNQDAIERVILRRLHEERIDGYTLEMAHEIAALTGDCGGGDKPAVFYCENGKNLDGLEQGALAVLSNLMMKTNATSAEFMIGNEKDGEFYFTCSRKHLNH